MNVYVKDPQKQAQACVIWMHGLGADAQDMVGLAEQLPLTVAVRHVFLDAPVRPVTFNNGMPMRAWYDILGMTAADREDSVGIANSEAFLRQVIDNQLAEGFASSQIFLAGFSQGGAMALFTGLQTNGSLGGIIALSAYLPLASACTIALNTTTPIFIVGGTQDQMVLPSWTRQVGHFLDEKGFKNVVFHEYPMGHSICMKEVNDLALWLNERVQQKEGDKQ